MVRSVIAENLPPALRQRVERGYAFLDKADHTFWQRTLNARGWGAPGWPVEYGGTGWNARQRLIYEDESARGYCPRTQPQAIKMVGPIIYTYGTDEQKRHFLPAMLNADDWWCQGYSEPGAGSDLASLGTRAVREGDCYRVNGQKTWTSLANWADWMFCLVRTQTQERPQKGITFLLIDMRTAGVTVRPIVSLDLGHHINEVFFEDVLVPVANRIGEEGKGWTYAKALLAHERVGIAELGRARERLDRLKRIAADPAINARHLDSDAVFQMKIAEIEIEVLAAEATTLRLMEQGQASPALPSLLKLRGSEISQRLTALLVEAIGPHALRYDLELAEAHELESPPLPSYALGRVPEYLTWRSLTIAGGSSEVQRNIIANLAFGK
jgi:alkylation response protein AidB-like acyl-CoA dehydrogenase